MKVEDIQSFKKKAMAWADSFEVCCYLDSNDFADQYGEYDFMIAAGVTEELRCGVGQAFEKWKAFYDLHKNWMFGFLSYDLKNETEALSSSNPDLLLFPDLYFFIPQYLILGKNDEVSVVFGDAGIVDGIQHFEAPVYELNSHVEVLPRVDKETYLRAVKALQEYILRGDIYEVNYCQEFFAANASMDPAAAFTKLNELSPTPFSGYFKHYYHYLLCASPERFLCKKGERLISQPIKGTAKRGLNGIEDERNRFALQNSAKEQAENVMIVDLVRNDLTRSAAKGTVVVNELFGIYEFAQVYQMISTISCDLDSEIHFIDAIKNAFPMGSMTGAPKVRAMELVEAIEVRKRGIYSGAMGYIDPLGNFDFNVIIRSLLYNSLERYLSFQVGGAITYAADPASEYEECLLKAAAMIETLSN